ncbi:MAG TPA: hypothetical protein VHA77_09385 [Xanthobacteraceae bacterium]|nr:hypothetical protein [Xanthobacteraceae bacterium]
MLCGAMVLVAGAHRLAAQDGTLPQNDPPPPQDAAPPPVEPPPAASTTPPQGPGLVDAFGHLFEQSLSAAGTGLGNAWGTLSTLGTQAGSAASGVAKGAADAAKGTADVVGRLPVSRIVVGHERCATAPNGAPDCQAAVDKLCRIQGFASGASLDTVSAENCPAEVVISGRPRTPEVCTYESFVTKAMCR